MGAQWSPIGRVVQPGDALEAPGRCYFLPSFSQPPHERLLPQVPYDKITDCDVQELSGLAGFWNGA